MMNSSSNIIYKSFKNSKIFLNKQCIINNGLKLNKKYFTTTSTKENSNNNNNNNNKNPKFIENNLFQKGLLTIGSAFVAFINPGRGDMVATLGEMTGGCAIKSMKQKMMLDPIGRQLLKEKPRIKESTYPLNIHLLPSTTFGGAYYRWMKEHGYSPDERTEVTLIQDEDDAYVMQRYREVHDFWHVLAGVRPDFQGEVAIKWFEFLQTGLPMNAIGSIIGPLRCSRNERNELINHMIPWAIKSSKSCVYLMNVKYEDHWEDDLNEFRAKLNFIPYKYLSDINQNKTTTINM
ncbi:hypothetical protein ACTFIR_008597 [Dictyostelium discoideum]